MGQWGAGLYQNDVAAEVREFCREIFRLPFATDRLVEMARQRFDGAASPADENHTDFLLALADQFHHYGLANEGLADGVAAMLKSGMDLERRRQLGMGERDLRRRAVALEKLEEKWSQPHPRPRRRLILLEPEPFLFTAGAVVSYPTQSGEPINPWFPTARVERDFAREGTGAFVVIAGLRKWEYIALYVIAILEARASGETEGLDQFVAPGRRFTATWVTMNKRLVRRMGCREIGTVVLREEAVAELLADPEMLRWAPMGLENALLLKNPGDRSAILRNVESYLH
ncbi:MAG: hypothetical protein K2Q23_09090 [Bryobacteraceae bacterium]|nr:hypothetical protein [Bryobacteraceae bacterium]